MRRAWATAVIVAAGLLVAGCGGGDDAPDLTEGLAPQEILDRSAEEGQKLESFRVEFEGDFGAVPAEGVASGLPLPASSLAAVRFTGAGPVVQPSRFSIDATAELGSLPVQVNVTRVDDELFVGLLGRDFQVQVPPEQLAVLDTTRAFPAVAGWVADPRNAGEEEIDGEPAVRIDGGVDADAVGDDLATLLASLPGVTDGAAPTPAEVRRRAAALQRELAGSTISVWVRTADLRPAQVRVGLNVEDASMVAPQLRSFRLEATVTLSDYDADLEVTAPQGARPLTPSELGGLLG